MLVNADNLWRPIVHVWIVTELADLTALISAEEVAMGRWKTESSAAVLFAKKVHAEAAFQATRNIVLDPNSGANRTLRWSVGPVHAASSANPPLTAQDAAAAGPMVVKRLRVVSEQLNQRLMIVYAPSVPRIMGGILNSHPDDAAWEALATLLIDSSIVAIDMREVFIECYSIDGKLPRGFQNGTPSFGHLNAVGNRLIATAIVERLINRTQP